MSIQNHIKQPELPFQCGDDLKNILTFGTEKNIESKNDKQSTNNNTINQTKINKQNASQNGEQVLGMDWNILQQLQTFQQSQYNPMQFQYSTQGGGGPANLESLFQQPQNSLINNNNIGNTSQQQQYNLNNATQISQAGSIFGNNQFLNGSQNGNTTNIQPSGFGQMQQSWNAQNLTNNLSTLDQLLNGAQFQQQQQTLQQNNNNNNVIRNNSSTSNNNTNLNGSQNTNANNNNQNNLNNNNQTNNNTNNNNNQNGLLGSNYVFDQSLLDNNKNLVLNNLSQFGQFAQNSSQYNSSGNPQQQQKENNFSQYNPSPFFNLSQFNNNTNNQNNNPSTTNQNNNNNSSNLNGSQNNNNTTNIHNTSNSGGTNTNNNTHQQTPNLNNLNSLFSASGQLKFPAHQTNSRQNSQNNNNNGIGNNNNNQNNGQQSNFQSTPGSLQPQSLLQQNCLFNNSPLNIQNFTSSLTPQFNNIHNNQFNFNNNNSQLQQTINQSQNDFKKIFFDPEILQKKEETNTPHSPVNSSNNGQNNNNGIIQYPQHNDKIIMNTTDQIKKELQSQQIKQMQQEQNNLQNLINQNNQILQQQQQQFSQQNQKQQLIENTNDQQLQQQQQQIQIQQPTNTNDILQKQQQQNIADSNEQNSILHNGILGKEAQDVLARKTKLKKFKKQPLPTTKHVPINMMNNLVVWLEKVFLDKIPCSCTSRYSMCKRCEELESIISIHKDRIKNMKSFQKLWEFKRVRLLSEEYFLYYGSHGILNKHYRSETNKQALYSCLKSYMEGSRNPSIFLRHR